MNKVDDLITNDEINDYSDEEEKYLTADQYVEGEEN